MYKFNAKSPTVLEHFERVFLFQNKTVHNLTIFSTNVRIACWEPSPHSTKLLSSFMAQQVSACSRVFWNLISAVASRNYSQTFGTRFATVTTIRYLLPSRARRGYPNPLQYCSLISPPQIYRPYQKLCQYWYGRDESQD